MTSYPRFDENFRDQLDQLFLWRRDVRRFQTTPIVQDVVNELLETAALSPSVGNSQPWRFVTVEDTARRTAIYDDFKACNAQALANYEGEQAKRYADLKLQGLDKAPIQIAVFCETDTDTGHGLGSRTMPETLRYSVVAAIQTLWLAARARGIGLGWVSILTPQKVTEILDVPSHWDLIAYLCMGYPEEEHADPELVRHGWQDRLDISKLMIQR